MRLLIMGAGSMGSAVGGFMARAGHDITLVGRAAHMRAITDRGLMITGIWGDHCVRGLDARTPEDGLPDGPFDAVLVTVKSYDTAAALDAAAPAVGPDTPVVAYQNGLGNMELVAARFGWERTAGARAIYGVRIPAPGQAEITVIANPTAVGAPRPEGPREKAQALALAMDAAGLPTEFTDRIETVLWAKVAYNCALNPLSALLDVPYGRLPDIPEARVLMDAAMEELYAVGRARGVALDPVSPGAYRDLFYTRLVPPTATHYASMHADFQRRRPTEIEALNGAIARFGREAGVPAPVNTFLTALVHARESALGVVRR